MTRSWKACFGGYPARSKISGSCFGSKTAPFFGGFKAHTLPQICWLWDDPFLLEFGLFLKGLLPLVLGKAAFIHGSNHSHHLVIVFYKKKRHLADGYCRSSNLKTSALGVMKRFPKMEAAHNRGECKWGDLKRSVFFWLVLRKGILA